MDNTLHMKKKAELIVWVKLSLLMDYHRNVNTTQTGTGPLVLILVLLNSLLCLYCIINQT